MRRDILEIDTATSRLLEKQLLSRADVEALRLLLGGNSVVDWQRLFFSRPEEVSHFLTISGLDLDDPVDRRRLTYVYQEALNYLEEQLKLRFPDDFYDLHDICAVFLWASQAGGFRRRQILACVVLKLMHVIHHMEAADLKFKVPISEEALFERAEQEILRAGARMQDELGVISFYGSRKSRNSVVTKLIAKKENIAATVFDKLRFRVVVENHADLPGALRWLVNEVVPFNYVIPGQSHNNLLDPAVLSDLLDPRDPLPPQVVAHATPEQVDTTKNEYSGANYRAINFIADYPLRIDRIVDDTFSFELGRVVYLMVEFQIVDQATAISNEEGDNAHQLYKERQRRIVARRLKRGGV